MNAVLKRNEARSDITFKKILCINVCLISTDCQYSETQQHTHRLLLMPNEQHKCQRAPKNTDNTVYCYHQLFFYSALNAGQTVMSAFLLLCSFRNRQLRNKKRLSGFHVNSRSTIYATFVIGYR